MADSSDDILKRVPPQNLEAEQSVLGAILLDNDAINQRSKSLRADDFYRESHREIFRAMVELYRPQPADRCDHADRRAAHQGRARGRLADRPISRSWPSIVPTAANVAHYARIVHEKAVLRSLASIATDIASSAYEAPADVDGFLDDAEHRIFEISENAASGRRSTRCRS